VGGGPPGLPPLTLAHEDVRQPRKDAIGTSRRVPHRLRWEMILSSPGRDCLQSHHSYSWKIIVNRKVLRLACCQMAQNSLFSQGQTYLLLAINVEEHRLAPVFVPKQPRLANAILKMSVSVLLALAFALILCPAESHAKGYCAGCSKEILSHENFIRVGLLKYHPRCFKCDKCKEVMEGAKFFVMEGYHICNSCYKKHYEQKCSICGKGLAGKKFWRIGEQVVDEKCYKKHFEPKCEICGKGLGGQEFYDIDGKYYDKKCYEKHIEKKCAHCGRGLSDVSYLEIDGKPYDTTCYRKHIAPKCAVCKKGIVGEYVFNDFHDTIHAAHEADLPTCCDCGRWISARTTDGGKTLQDGRTMCNLCYDQLIELVDAEAQMDTVASEMIARGIDVDISSVELNLVDQELLDSLNRFNRMDNPQAHTSPRSTRNGDGQAIDMKCQVYLLRDKSRTQFRRLLAHELMHVWFFQQDRVPNKSAYLTGSCKYASMIPLENDSSMTARVALRKLQEDDHPAYGESFRQIQAFVDSVGVEGWLEHCRTSQDAPW